MELVRSRRESSGGSCCLCKLRCVEGILAVAFYKMLFWIQKQTKQVTSLCLYECASPSSIPLALHLSCLGSYLLKPIFASLWNGQTKQAAQLVTFTTRPWVIWRGKEIWNACLNSRHRRPLKCTVMLRDVFVEGSFQMKRSVNVRLSPWRLKPAWRRCSLTVTWRRTASC